jgi:hypothetical protein
VSNWGQAKTNEDTSLFQKMLARVQALDGINEKYLAKQQRDILIAETQLRTVSS